MFFTWRGCHVVAKRQSHIQPWNASDPDNVKSTYAYGNLTTWNGTKIVSDFASCILSSCTEKNISTCADSTLGLKDISVTARHLEEIYLGFYDFCSWGVKVNSDIAGPGVMISYLLQICAVIALWVLFNILTKCEWIVVLPRFWRLTPRRYDPQLTHPPSNDRVDRLRQAWTTSVGTQERLSKRRLYKATDKTLNEFQEVQAFFIGAIQIATLATFKPQSSESSDASSVTSFGAALMDSQLVQMLAINSMIPLLLVQCMLQRSEKHEIRRCKACNHVPPHRQRCTKHTRSRLWYSSVLVLVTVVLAIVVHTKRDTLIANFDDLFKNFQENSAVGSCGGNPNPMVYCNVDTGLNTRFNMGFVVICVSFSFLAVDFLARQSPVWTRWQHSRLKVQSWMSAEGINALAHFKSNWTIFVKVVWFGLETLLFTSSVLYLTDLLNIAKAMTNGTNSWGSWSFGQLIAVMVWVPTGLRFLYYLAL